MLETPGLVAEKEPMQEVAPLGGKPGCTPWESLRGCQWDLQEMFGPGTADLRSLQWAKGSAFSHKGLGNPAWKGMGWASLHHPTKAAACLRLGVAACCGAGGFTGAPRVPCIPCSSSSSFISVLEAFCLLGSNFASGVHQEEGCTMPAAGLAERLGLFLGRLSASLPCSGQTGGISMPPNSVSPCSLQSGQFNEDMIPTVGFNMRKITKGNVTIKVRYRCYH